MSKYYVFLAFLLAVSPVNAEDLYVRTLSWSDCVSYARKNHPDLQSSIEKINQAKAGAGVTRSSILPEIDGNASVSRSRSSYETGNQGGASSITKDSYSYSVSGQQLLFDGFKSIYDIKSANSIVEQSRYSYEVTSSQIRFNLRSAYVQLLKFQESIKISKEILELRKKNLELVKIRYDAGREHRGSLMTAQANMAQAESDLAQAGRNILLAQRRLMKEMALREYINIRINEDMTAVNADKAKPDFNVLAMRNPSLQVMSQQIKAAEYNVKSAKLDYSPKIYATGSIGRTDSKFPPDNNAWSVGVQATLPIIQGGKQYYTASRAEASYRQLIADEKSTRDSVIVLLEQSWVNWQNSLDVLEVQQRYLRAAEERAKIAEAQYSMGIIIFDNWIIIENDLVSSKKSYLDAESAAMTAEATWIQAKGETLDYDK